MATPYVTVTELAAYTRVADGDDDVQMGVAVAAASHAIDTECRRQFGALGVGPRIYTARPGPGAWLVDIDDLATTDALAVAVDLAGDGGYATPLTGYALAPVNAGTDGEPFTQLRFAAPLTVARDAVRVTGSWGWVSVPDAIRQACLLQASRLLARRDSPFGISGSPDSGGELRLLARLDPDVAVLVRGYKRKWWAV